MTATTLLAFYGALLSTVALVWNFLRDLRDNPRVKVRISLKPVAYDSARRPYAVALDLPIEGASEQVFLYFNIVNVGRRKVILTGMGGDQRSGHKHFLIPKPVVLTSPVTLEEGQEISELSPDLSLVGNNTRRLYIWDTAGRHWKVGWTNLRKVRKQVKKHTVSADAAASSE
jgi:hypothetical protein